MKFYTNKISTGKSSSFKDFVQKIAESNAEIKKSASVQEESKIEKKANLDNFGDKKAAPFGKKDTESKEKTEDKAEAKKEDCDTKCEEKKEEKEVTASVEVVAAAKEESKEVKVEEAKKQEEKKEETVVANSGSRMVRIANLDSKTKTQWKTYWSKLYPKAYVDAMFADK